MSRASLALAAVHSGATKRASQVCPPVSPLGDGYRPGAARPVFGGRFGGHVCSDASLAGDGGNGGHFRERSLSNFGGNGGFGER
jgi:hypothetical protein